jgi:RimJ/RimL family protein N-acetyltransferase
MSERAAAVCDGRGAIRLLLAMTEPAATKAGAAVRLRLATLADGERMFAWQSDPRTRRFARNPEPPKREEHWSWLRTAVSDPSRLLCIVERDGEAAGVLRLDRREEAAGAAETHEVSILIDPSRYGEGLAVAALRFARDAFPGWRLIAEVLPGNDVSHALFRAAGYRQENDRWYACEPIEDRT